MSIKTKKFGLPKKPFRERVIEVVSAIPKGQAVTYKQVAAWAGSPGAYRAVGNIMASNKDSKHIPCHRVIRSDGKVGGYGMGGAKRKEELLRKERAIK